MSAQMNGKFLILTNRQAAFHIQQLACETNAINIFLPSHPEISILDLLITGGLENANFRR